MNEKKQRLFFLYIPFLGLMIFVVSILVLPLDKWARDNCKNNFNKYNKQLNDVALYIEKNNTQFNSFFDINFELNHNSKLSKFKDSISVLLNNLPIKKVLIDDKRRFVGDNMYPVTIYMKTELITGIWYNYYYVYTSIPTRPTDAKGVFDFVVLNEKWSILIDKNNNL